MTPTLRACLSSALALALGACSLSPHYQVPTPIPAAPGQPAPALPPAFKVAPDWVPARPADDVAKGDWWHMFGDPVLNGLEEKVVVTNQNVASARAASQISQAVMRACNATTGHRLKAPPVMNRNNE